MLNTPIECRDFGRMLESRRREGRYQECLEEVCTLRRAGEITDNFSLRQIFENTVPDGREALLAMESARRAGTGMFMEAAGDAVQTSDFSNIIGQITYGDLLERFESPDLIAGRLLRERPAITSQREQVPGITMIGDKGASVGENEEYPSVKIGAKHIVMPEAVKNGFQLPITEEVIAEDKTGQVMDAANQAIDWLAVGQEKERLQTILGITTSFRWQDQAAEATYANSFAGFTLDNLLSNTLIDYTSIDTAKNSFNDTIDPNTGEPVSINGNIQIIVPDTLETRLAVILRASSIVQGAIDADTPRQMSANPLSFGSRRYEPYSSQYVEFLTNSTSTWFIGKFTEAFEDRVVWPLQMFVADRSHAKVFDMDYVSIIKVRRKSAVGVRSPWKIRKCT